METARFLPTTAKEVARLGWDYLDVILFSGDAYIDHPSFGVAVIGRVLEAAGYRVAIVPQPNWQDDLRDFRKLGRPRLFFGVTAGAMDSMVNHYTPTKRLRSDDAYTPSSRAGARPDYPTIVYTRILKEIYPDVPVILGGIEASLRRLTHYDYWSDGLRASFLVESGADAIVYGMGEKPMVALAKAIEDGGNWRATAQVVHLADSAPQGAIVLNSYESCVEDKRKWGENFVKFEIESNRYVAGVLAEQCGDKFVVVNSPYPPLSQGELDAAFDLPYARLPHPRYKDKPISAYQMIKHSVNIHRGCFGGCSFCTISAHQGKFISSRSEKSIINEIKQISQLSDFKGNLSDVGGPSANMWNMGGENLEQCYKCTRPSCIYPKICANLNNDHHGLLKLYDAVEKLPQIKRFYIGSGIRYDMFDGTDEYLHRVITRHTSGRFKVAPEHTEDKVLKLMRKPSFKGFEDLTQKVHKICTQNALPSQVVPYFISSHPGCSMEDMRALSGRIRGLEKNVHIESVQDFTPTPMTLSSAMYFLGENPYTGETLYIERTRERKNAQKDYFYSRNTSKPYTNKPKSYGGKPLKKKFSKAKSNKRR